MQIWQLSLFLDNKFNQVVVVVVVVEFIRFTISWISWFSTLREPSVNKKDQRVLTLVGPPRNNPEPNPLAVLHLNNQLCIFIFGMQKGGVFSLVF